MKLNNTLGCSLCNSTWGEYWEEIDNQKLLFCCDICAKAFINMVQKVKDITHWNNIDELRISGNTRGRSCLAQSNKETLSFNILFDSSGSISYFSVNQ